MFGWGCQILERDGWEKIGLKGRNVPVFERFLKEYDQKVPKWFECSQ